MQRLRLPAVLCAFALALVASGCASTRSISVGSNTPTYSIDIVNQLPNSMTAYWSDGGEPKELGSVGSGRTERFLIAGAKTNVVSITARDASGSRNSGPYSVSLQTGSAQTVTLR